MFSFSEDDIMALIDIFLSVAKILVMFFDIATYPIYYVHQRKWESITEPKTTGDVRLVVKHDNKSVCWRRDKGKSSIYEEIIVRGGVNTVTKAFAYAVNKFGDRDCLGTRDVIGEEDERQSNGKIFQKLALGDYRWKSYNTIYREMYNFGKGLRALGNLPGQRISIYAETREEWIIACLGAFSQNISVATVYTNLGDDAVVHAVNETQVTTLITSHELLPRFYEMLPKLHEIATIIVMESTNINVKTNLQGYKNGVEIIPYSNVLEMGSKRDDIEQSPPTPEDTAIIMYTSGSTGTPKGVTLTHKNLVATMTCLMFMLDPKDEIYIAYLPLAHVLELLSENTMMLFGIKVGYSSPNTMTDLSTKVLKGYKGDASILKPTLMCAVPLIMDRIYKNITDSVKKKGPLFQKIFQFAFEYKRYWMKSGFQTPIIDKICFNKIRNLLGGEIRLILVGGAPLSPDVHTFVRTCLGCVLVQGYSLTESTCSGTVMEKDDLSEGTVGFPMTDMHVKLENWEEGNYRVTDKPNPRGEIILSGSCIAKDYFNMPEVADNVFYNENGRRWLRTGDIGEFDSKGKLRIIDRKKDLVKLQLGEYVSLGKVESLMKTNPLIENICVYGDPYKQSVVALVCPSRPRLESLAHSKLGKTEDFDSLCCDNDVIKAVLVVLEKHGRSAKLKKFEIPSALTLCPEQWTPESGLITAAFKLKRKVLQTHYQSQIDMMYQRK